MKGVEDEYLYPYFIYTQYFPNGNIDEFNQAFVTFDVSEEEFNQIKNETCVCWNTVVFDLKYIKTPLRKCFGTIKKNNIKNRFRKDKSVFEDIVKIKN